MRKGEKHFGRESSIDRETVGREAQGVEVVVLLLGSAGGSRVADCPRAFTTGVGPSVGKSRGLMSAGGR